MPWAIWLYFSSSSSGVASLATGLTLCGTVVLMLTALPPRQPEENTASVAPAVHASRRRFNELSPMPRKRSNLSATSNGRQFGCRQGSRVTRWCHFDTPAPHVDTLDGPTRGLG